MVPSHPVATLGDPPLCLWFWPLLLIAHGQVLCFSGWLAHDVGMTRHSEQVSPSLQACSPSLPCNALQTVAEQAAWEIAKKDDLDLCVINPTFVLGPVISDRTDATSIKSVKVGHTCAARWPQAQCLVPHCTSDLPSKYQSSFQF